MIDDEKLMQQALDDLIEAARLLGGTQALKRCGTYTQQDARFEQAMHEAVQRHRTALRERLEQPEQEPCAFCGYTAGHDIKCVYLEVQEPVAKDAEEWGSRLNRASWAAIEAWNSDVMGPMSGAVFNNIKGVVRAAILKYVEGYTAPQRREWVGLTEEEIDAVDEANWDEDHKAWGIREFARAVEAKLREKNGGGV